MKKNTKGAIAAGAAALLLAGGAGTFAAWSDEAELGGGDVNSGHLRITEAAGTGEWVWATDGVTGDFDPETDTIVPGDSIEYTADYTLEVEGTNLVASLTPTLGGLTGDEELLEQLTFASDSDTTGLDLDSITEANDGATVSVTTTITFDPATTDQVGAEQTVSLADSTILLEQTAPASN